MAEKEERGDFTRRKTKLALLAATILVVATLLFTPIIPVKAEIAHGQTVMNPQYQKILSYGNFSAAFNLQNFVLDISTSNTWINITAESFTVVANTETIMNQTTAHLTIQLTNVNAVIPINNDNPSYFNLQIGSATLNVDLTMQGQYVSYAFYANTVTSVAQLIQNVLNNI